jgi:hypothetical protein
MTFPAHGTHSQARTLTSQTAASFRQTSQRSLDMLPPRHRNH